MISRKRFLACAVAFTFLLSLLPAAAGASALNASCYGFSATVGGDGNTNGISFTIGAQGGTAPYTFTYQVAGPVSVSGSASAGSVHLAGTFPTGAYIVTAIATDAESAVNTATMNVNYTNLTSTYEVNITSQDRPATIYVTGITLTPETLMLAVGGSSQLTAEVAPNDADNAAVSYASSNSSVATVSSQGVVTAVAPGNVTVTCSALDGSGQTDTCAVQVWQPVTDIAVTPSVITLAVSETVNLTSAVFPATASNPLLNWSSDATGVATVSSSGVVTAVSAGTAVITAAAQDGTGKTDTCTVTVGQKVTAVHLNSTSAAMTVGQTLALTADVDPDNASNPAVVWTSSDSGIASVSSSGIITANAVGSAVITATAQDGSGFSEACTVAVGAATASPAPTAVPTVTPTPAPGGQSARVTTVSGGLNLRISPNVTSTRLMVVPRNAYVTVNTYGTVWCYITYAGVSGYGMTAFLTINSSVTPAPTVTPTPAPGTQYAQVITASGGLNLRASASSSAARLLVIPRYAYVTVLSYGAVWCRVTYGLATGYVMTSFLRLSGSTAVPTATATVTPTPAPGTQYARVTTAAGGLNLRLSASKTSARLLVIPQSAYVTVQSYGAVWSRVTYNGTTGYVMSVYITLVY